MDDLQQHIQESLKDSEFSSAWVENEFTYEVSRQLIALRLKRGMTQKDVAQKVGTTQSVIARIENGEQNISIKTLSKLAEALKANVKIELQAR
jgi:predicted transcriptional regulator